MVSPSCSVQKCQHPFCGVAERSIVANGHTCLIIMVTCCSPDTSRPPVSVNSSHSTIAGHCRSSLSWLGTVTICLALCRWTEQACSGNSTDAVQIVLTEYPEVLAL